jgi:hypothetical protein
MKQEHPHVGNVAFQSHRVQVAWHLGDYAFFQHCLATLDSLLDAFRHSGH